MGSSAKARFSSPGAFRILYRWDDGRGRSHLHHRRRKGPSARRLRGPQPYRAECPPYRRRHPPRAGRITLHGGLDGPLDTNIVSRRHVPSPNPAGGRFAQLSHEYCRFRRSYIGRLFSLNEGSASRFLYTKGRDPANVDEHDMIHLIGTHTGEKITGFYETEESVEGDANLIRISP